ncbi:MAG: FAD-dependent oxidoreductase [Oscillatoriaceae cyanobacterium]
MQQFFVHQKPRLNPRMYRRLLSISCSLIALAAGQPALSAPPRNPDREVTCDLLVVGGGLSGAAAAYEALHAGRTVCLTEITDWVGGQISAQGTSALDERPTQRQLRFFPRGYLEFRDRIQKYYGRLNPGQCWVSESCFLPYDGHKLLFEILQSAAKKGKGTLKWYPNTVIKDVDIASGQIKSAIAIQHQPAPGAPPLNTFPLSQTILEAYRYENSPQLDKTIIRFIPSPPPVPKRGQQLPPRPAEWYVVDATETGEIIGLADVPYRLGLDARSHLEPSSASETGDPYCTQGFTYTFAMQATAEPQTHDLPPYYERYAPYYSYELERLADFNLVYTYRRIWSATHTENLPSNVRQWPINPGDISMQNWTWGNDYRPGTAADNLIYTREQLEEMGQLEPGGWMGGLRAETLRAGEDHAKGYFYWLVAGTTDSQLGDGVKKTYPNHQFMTGLDSPMGTVHGLSKYPYMREGRRIIGRPSWAHPDGFTVWEIDISRRDYRDEFYRLSLLPEDYRRLWQALAGLDTTRVVRSQPGIEDIEKRGRGTVFPDAVGIGHYAIDFHPCMTLSPPEAPGNSERDGDRRGQGTAYPFQIPMRAMIPQKIDNMLVAGKSIATSHVAAAAYRVHSFEWSAGAAAGTAAAFALEKGIMPYQMVDDLTRPEPELALFRQRLEANGNPTAFPNTSIFNNSWEDWR